MNYYELDHISIFQSAMITISHIKGSILFVILPYSQLYSNFDIFVVIKLKLKTITILLLHLFIPSH